MNEIIRKSLIGSIHVIQQTLSGMETMLCHLSPEPETKKPMFAAAETAVEYLTEEEEDALAEKLGLKGLSNEDKH
jgi:hypothetical protein